MTSILELKNITKTFLTADQKINIFNDLSFQFHQNKSYAIMGVSGIGKSTLINLISSLDFPVSGSILFDGFNLNNFSQEQNQIFLNESIGLIFQESNLINELTVIENVMLKGFIKKRDLNYCKNFAQELLKKVDLADKANEYPSKLSGGQQQRVAICRAIFNKPKFLLADEPTGNLDEKTAKNIAELLFECKELWQMGLIIATHDKNLAGLADEILVIKDGRLERF